MRLATRAVASIARALGSSGLRLALLHCRRPLFAILRHPPISSLVTTPVASTAPNNKSKFTGVSWKCATKKWSAQISIDGKVQHLGYFNNEDDAARAFDERAAPLGRRVNFPGPGQAPALKQGAHGIVSRYPVVC